MNAYTTTYEFYCQGRLCKTWVSSIKDDFAEALEEAFYVDRLARIVSRENNGADVKVHMNGLYLKTV